MILVDSLLYKIDQKLNKLSTFEGQKIPLEDKVLALNEAQTVLIKNKVTGFVPESKGLGMSSFIKRYMDLQSIVVPYTELNAKLTDKKLNRWTIKLPTGFMFYIDSYGVADKDRCRDRIVWVNNDLTKHSDVSVLMNNEHTKPSFEWQETFSTISDGYLGLFTDGSFTFSKIAISYIRYPVKIDKEGYVNFDGKDSKNTDCELEEYLEDELVDIAVMRLGMYTENQSAVQNSQYRIQTNE